ncbi:MAG: SIMPL domain-containing protein [Chitinophagales bacterium]|nr:SIMPL domain-containing protein [Chitinophagales bacterium]HAE12779.1 SIMPL domain-containing protein [Bacteroidota bacterium]MCB9021601.1 SIMPL domain-containing protein [Chitinophagales bacterium]MCB9031146.1 SIMPL domain-containing protein [Chitinophagales bacterium]HAE35689.1 SIMPL domain-containing protein [Bacteroidota bacterium]
MRSILPTIIIAAGVVLTGMILGNAFKNRYDYQQTIAVTGLGKTDFESDLVVWSGYFQKKNPDLKEAYAQLNEDRDLIKSYLKEKGIPDNEIKFSSVDINRDYDSYYDTNGKYVSRFAGYSLNQYVTIESHQLDEIDALSREVTELINKGVEFYSNQPSYYFTRLDSLKIDLIARATEDGRKRAENIAEQAHARLGSLTNASMGVFQIIAQNSTEDYSWGGTFNTSSRFKTANITVKLEFESK